MRPAISRFVVLFAVLEVACSRPKLASHVELPTRWGDGIGYLITLRIDGGTTEWLVDTGAEFSVVTQSAANRLGLVGSRGVPVTGVTGAVHVGRVTALPALLADVRTPMMSRSNWLRHPLLADLLPRVWPRQWFELFLSAPKVRFPWVHVDRDHTHAWLGQIYGAKKIWLWPTSAAPLTQKQHIIGKGADLTSFFKGHSPSTVVVGPTDLAFIPADWWHTVESQSVSITVSGNWVERLNWSRFFKSYFAQHAKSQDVRVIESLEALDGRVTRYFERSRRRRG